MGVQAASIRFSTAVLLGALAAGCSSTRVVEEVPFHIALKPFEVRTARTGMEGVLVFDEEAVSRSFATVLADGGFTRVTLLKEPASGATTDDAYWIRRAEAVQADLIADCTFTFDPTFDSGINWTFAPNVLLYLMLGPVAWFPPDRTYEVKADIEASFYDVESIARFGKLDRRRRLDRIDAEVTEIPMSFIDRGGLSPLWIVASIVIPPGFLAQDTEELHERLRDSVTQKVAETFRERVGFLDRDNLMQPSSVAFHLRDGRAVRGPGGEVRVQGEVWLDPQHAERMESCTLGVGGKSKVLYFDQPTSTGKYLVYALDETITVDAGADTSVLKLRLLEGSQEQITRSYTFTVREAAADA